MRIGLTTEDDWSSQEQKRVPYSPPIHTMVSKRQSLG